MTRLSTVLIVLGLSVPAAAAGSEPAGNPHDPEVNFEYVWRSIDRTYGQFSIKNVDWDMLYRMYRPQVTAGTADNELWDILVTMLGTLNDAHVCLADGKRRICAGTEYTLAEDFSVDLVKTKYLHGKSSAAREGTYTSGWLTDQIGYLHIADLKRDSEPHIQAIDAFLRDFGSARALVIDVRANPGGSGRNHEIVASRFADRRRQFMQSQTRYGPKHDDLWPPEYKTVEPDGPIQFTRPVVLLINRGTASGPEGFTLAMRVLPHVTLVGDLTEGALSSQFPDRLPNGWTLWVAFKVTSDHEGVCWDGLGIPPDLRVLNTPAEITAGRDRQLEFAQRLLERGAPEPQDEAPSLTAVKTSLVGEYARGVRQQQVEAAVAALNRARAARSDTAFFGVDEAMQFANQCLGRKQYPAAIGLLKAVREDFPKLAATYAMLAQAYLGAGDVAAAEAALAEGNSVEPMFPPEAQQIERARTAVRKAKVGSAAEIVERALADGGIPVAEKTFQELLARRDTGPVFEESDFNALGYRLLQERNLETAVFVFEKGVQLFPDSWNAFDSLGEALVQAGQKGRAIASYRKSLELNPGNAGGQETLKRLEAGQ
jgi:predicted negative regulator of RcsB-dependent stress response